MHCCGGILPRRLLPTALSLIISDQALPAAKESDLPHWWPEESFLSMKLSLIAARGAGHLNGGEGPGLLAGAVQWVRDALENFFLRF